MIKIIEDNTNIVPEKEQELLKALLKDIKEINNLIPNKEIFIYWQDYHDEYSLERVDPCPDYYGYYSIGTNNFTIGDKVPLEELDNIIYIISECVEFLFNS